MTVQYQVSISGAIDPHRDEKMAGEFGGMPTTYAGSKAIARSNMRYNAIIDQLSLLAGFDITNIEVTGRGQNTAATSIEFVLTFHRNSSSYLKVEDSANPGTFLYGLDAAKRMIAKALSTDYNQNYSYWDPTVRVTRTNTNTTTQTTPPRGFIFESVDATKLYSSISAAEAAITITEI